MAPRRSFKVKGLFRMLSTGFSESPSSFSYAVIMRIGCFGANRLILVEHEDGLVEVEHTRKLSTGQRQFLKALEHAGKTLRYITPNR